MVRMTSIEETQKHDGILAVRLQDTREELDDFLLALYDSRFVLTQKFYSTY